MCTRRWGVFEGETQAWGETSGAPPCFSHLVSDLRVIMKPAMGFQGVKSFEFHFLHKLIWANVFILRDISVLLVICSCALAGFLSSKGRKVAYVTYTLNDKNSFESLMRRRRNVCQVMKPKWMSSDLAQNNEWQKWFTHLINKLKIIDIELLMIKSHFQM